MPDPFGMGWNRNSESKLQPLPMTKEPTPKACESSHAHVKQAVLHYVAAVKKQSYFPLVLVGAKKETLASTQVRSKQYQKCSTELI